MKKLFIRVIKKFFVGIDVSKKTIDVAYCITGMPIYLGSYPNNKTGFKSMISDLQSKTKFKKDEWFICFENTGVYSKLLLQYLFDKNIARREENALHLSKSLGIKRAKTDKIDAIDICRYSFEKRDIIKQTEPLPQAINSLRKLLRRRDLLIKQKGGIVTSLQDQKSVMDKELYAFFSQQNQNLITVLKQEIKAVELKINEIMKTEEALTKNRKLLISVKGIGVVVSAYLIAYTNNFTIVNDARKFAAYASIAPFPNQSGSSIRGREKVSFYGNRKFRSLLSNSARSVVRWDGQLKSYYERRIAEGKHKGIVLNNIKNKIIQRAFAVIKRQTPYVEVMNYV